MSDTPKLSWEYVRGEELAIFWESPYGHGKEKIASFWWPGHPPEATLEVEASFEAIAARAVNTELEQQVESLRAELAASAEVIKKTQDIYDDTVRECLEVRGQLDAEKQRADALDWLLSQPAYMAYSEDGEDCWLHWAWDPNDEERGPFNSPIFHDKYACLDAARKPVP